MQPIGFPTSAKSYKNLETFTIRYVSASKLCFDDSLFLSYTAEDLIKPWCIQSRDGVETHTANMGRHLRAFCKPSCLQTHQAGSKLRNSFIFRNSYYSKCGKGGKPYGVDYYPEILQ
jgi:hypothetical protein